MGNCKDFPFATLGGSQAMVITSTENAKVASAAKLLEKKHRKSTGLYLIEGERLVCDAFKHGAEIVDVFVKESTQDKFGFPNQIVVSDRVFSKLCDTVNSQGVLAVVKQPQRSFAEPCGNSLVLDGLQDPGNVGTLIRTAAACGFSDVFAVNCVDLFSPKVLRSAMSAHFCLNVWQFDNVEQLFPLLGCQIVAADMNGENVFSAQFAPKVAVVLGNEGNGLSAYSKTHADKIVSLPMKNNFESLNVAVAGSVIMYQIFANLNK